MKEQTYKAIDLNLPSGTIWADRNICAENPWDNGLYFSWGNVDGHTVDEDNFILNGYSFDKKTYHISSGGQYTGSELDTEHDAATVNMGSDWRIPTSTEISELVENTDHYYINLKGNIVAGPFNHENNRLEKGLDCTKKLRSICFVKHGEAFDYNNRSNFIEFPFTGCCKGNILIYKGICSTVWANSLGIGETKDAQDLYFDGSGELRICGEYGDRYYGRSIRGVIF